MTHASKEQRGSGDMRYTGNREDTGDTLYIGNRGDRADTLNTGDRAYLQGHALHRELRIFK